MGITNLEKIPINCMFLDFLSDIAHRFIQIYVAEYFGTMEFIMCNSEESETEKKSKKKKKFRGEVYIDADRCKGCGFCAEFCPTQTLSISEKFNLKGYHPPEVTDLDACTGCGLCGMYCPDFAIFGIRVKIDGAEAGATTEDRLAEK